MLRVAGSSIIPFLLEDMLDPHWHCTHCYGEGFEFPPDWVWDNEKRNWPTDTGVPCTECKGKGSINSWACGKDVATNLCVDCFADKAKAADPLTDETIPQRTGVSKKSKLSLTGLNHPVTFCLSAPFSKGATCLSSGSRALKRLLVWMKFEHARKLSTMATTAESSTATDGRSTST